MAFRSIFPCCWCVIGAPSMVAAVAAVVVIGGIVLNFSRAAIGWCMCSASGVLKQPWQLHPTQYDCRAKHSQ